MTNHMCQRCRIFNTDYFPCFGFYGCLECGHTWGGILEGKKLNRAWYTFTHTKLKGTDSEVRQAHSIIFDNLDVIATAIECNLGVKKLPDNSRWWIEYQDEIESKLLTIETPKDLPT